MGHDSDPGLLRAILIGGFEIGDNELELSLDLLILRLIVIELLEKDGRKNAKSINSRANVNMRSIGINRFG